MINNIESIDGFVDKESRALTIVKKATLPVWKPASLFLDCYKETKEKWGEEMEGFFMPGITVGVGLFCWTYYISLGYGVYKAGEYIFK